MDGIANVTKQQQSQVNIGEMRNSAAQQVQESSKSNVVEQIQKEVTQSSQKIDSKEKVQDLVKQLNDAMAPMNTNIKFGVDSQDVFFVSVIESETSKMIRRFPAEQAADFLPKMQEVTGILFDTKG